MPPEPNRVREHREGARFTRQQPGEAIEAERASADLRKRAELAELLDTGLDDLFFGDEARESIEEAYERGRRDEREEAAAGAGIEPEPGDDPHGIGAWVSAAVKRPPAEPDLVRVFRIDNPRGTRRKLDAVVRVQVDRLPPRLAARALKELASEEPGSAETKIEGSTAGPEHG